MRSVRRFMILNCWMSWRGCAIADGRVPGVARVLRTGSSGRGDWREEDRLGVGGRDVVRRGIAEAGAWDVWVGGGGVAVVCGGTLISCDVGGAGYRDGVRGAGGDTGGDSSGDDCGARVGVRGPWICGGGRGCGAVDCVDRSAPGLAACGAGAGAVPAIRYLEAVADPAAGAVAGGHGNHAGRRGGRSARAGVRAGVE